MYIRIYKLHPYSLPPLGVSHTKKSGNDRSHKPDSNERRKWYLLELNQGHMDFQSIALPPELRHQVAMLFGMMLFPYCGCKGIAFSLTPQIFEGKFSIFFSCDNFCEILSVFFRCLQKKLYLCSRYRDVAQLVAHYVRDVGVASSSPVIPTYAKRRLNFSRLFAYILTVKAFPNTYHHPR